MKVSYLKPANKIAEYVQEILVLEDQSTLAPFVLPLFANGMPTLLFQTEKGRIKNSDNYLTLFGQTISPTSLTVNGPFILVAYFLKPCSLVSLFGISARELADNPINLNLLSSGKAKFLQDQLLNADSIDSMILLLDEYLFHLSTKINADIHLVKYATDKIVQNPHGKILKQVQSELCVTERTFQRMFDQNVGISPTQFRRICQFHNAFQQLNRQRLGSLTQIAFHHWYADQSHYIRAFREFTNVTPTEYLNYGTIS